MSYTARCTVKCNTYSRRLFEKILLAGLPFDNPAHNIYAFAILFSESFAESLYHVLSHAVEVVARLPVPLFTRAGVVHLVGP